MEQKTILTAKQQQLLNLLFAQKEIEQHFYLSGGTTLAEYYLHHRLSEDLDFFSPDEVNPIAIQIILKKLTPQTQITKIDYQQSFNRNLFFLHFKNEIIKTKFTYYPFTQIGAPKKIQKIIIDNIIDIAVNKTFTIYQTPRSRDFIDLYLILHQQNWTFADLVKKAKIKFDTHLDPLQLGQQLLEVTQVKDYPNMLTKLNPQTWQTYWLNEATKLKKEAIK